MFHQAPPKNKAVLHNHNLIITPKKLVMLYRRSFLTRVLRKTCLWDWLVLEGQTGSPCRDVRAGRAFVMKGAAWADGHLLDSLTAEETVSLLHLLLSHPSPSPSSLLSGDFWSLQKKKEKPRSLCAAKELRHLNVFSNSNISWWLESEACRLPVEFQTSRNQCGALSAPTPGGEDLFLEPYS